MRLLTTTANASAFRDAVDMACGYPRRARVVGAPDALPTVYASGAPGWTAQSGATITALGNGYSTVTVPEQSRQYLGVTVGEFAIPSIQRSVMLAGQSNARDCVVPDMFTEGWFFQRVAVGGTGLLAGWEIGGSLYNQTVAACAGLTPGLEFWWIQGERDANDAAWAPAYLANLTALFAAFRADIGDFNARICLLNSACGYPYTAVVRQAQIDFCAADPSRNVPFDMDTFTANYDGLHYDAVGNAAVGTALAATRPS